MTSAGHTRRVRVSFWTERRSLSDDAKLLCLRLLTGPETLPIPGVVLVGREALAEAMGWRTKRLAVAFAELARTGLAVGDWAERLVWFPEALRHRPPDNPKQVTGWRDYWPLVPACDLRFVIYRALQAEVVGRGGDFEASFGKAIPSPSAPETVSGQRRDGMRPPDETVPETGQGGGSGSGKAQGVERGGPPTRIRPDSPSNLLHCLKVAMEAAHPEIGFWQGGNLGLRIAREFYDQVHTADPTIIEERIKVFVEDPRAEKANWTVKSFVELFNGLRNGAGGRDPRVGPAAAESDHATGEGRL